MGLQQMQMFLRGHSESRAMAAAVDTHMSQRYGIVAVKTNSGHAEYGDHDVLIETVRQNSPGLTLNLRGPVRLYADLVSPTVRIEPPGRYVKAYFTNINDRYNMHVAIDRSHAWDGARRGSHIDLSQLPRLPKQRTIECEVRDGQSWFAGEVSKNFSGACAVTGATSLLDACHLIPWSICPDALKLDRRNGLLLVRPLHGLYDASYWTIDGSGRVIITAKPLNTVIARMLDLIKSAVIRRPQVPLLDEALDWRRQEFLRNEMEGENV